MSMTMRAVFPMIDRYHSPDVKAWRDLRGRQTSSPAPWPRAVHLRLRRHRTCSSAWPDPAESVA